MSTTILASEVAKKFGVKPKIFRKFLRNVKEIKGIKKEKGSWFIVEEAISVLEKTWKEKGHREKKEEKAYSPRKSKEVEDRRPPKEFEDGLTHWFPLKVSGGREIGLKKMLDSFIKKKLNQMELIEEVYVPTYKVKIKEKIKEIALFSKMVFVRTDSIKTIFWKIKEVSPFVKGWWNERTASYNFPKAIEDDYIAGLRKEYEGKIFEEGEEKKKEWKVGDYAEILRGPFKGFIGKLLEMTNDTTVLEIAIFGRLIPVNLDFGSIKQHDPAAAKELSYDKKERRLKNPLDSK